MKFHIKKINTMKNIIKHINKKYRIIEYKEKLYFFVCIHTVYTGNSYNIVLTRKFLVISTHFIIIAKIKQIW